MGFISNYREATWRTFDGSMIQVVLVRDPALGEPMTTTTKHPAKFSKAIMDLMASLIFEEAQRVTGIGSLKILDPFAGTGKIHDLLAVHSDVRTYGIEIEREWAEMGPECYVCDGKGVLDSPRLGEFVTCRTCNGSGSRTALGNALALPFGANFFEMVCTSPTYGNRMADHHDAKDGSRRMTYKHVLGHDLHPDNSGQLHFGDEYKAFHVKAWKEVARVIRQPVHSGSTLTYPGGLFVLNVSNFIKKNSLVDVVQWHYDTVIGMGYDLEQEHDVPTPRLRYGANHSARVTHEKIFVFRRTMNR